MYLKCITAGVSHWRRERQGIPMDVQLAWVQEASCTALQSNTSLLFYQNWLGLPHLLLTSKVNNGRGFTAIYWLVISHPDTAILFYFVRLFLSTGHQSLQWSLCVCWFSGTELSSTLMSLPSIEVTVPFTSVQGSNSSPLISSMWSLHPEDRTGKQLSSSPDGVHAESKHTWST